MPERYYLSSTACLGILRRANRRGKELPKMLKAALVQMIRRDGETFGQKEIEDAGKILRTLWCEVGTQAFAEWVRRTFVFLQSEEILFF